MEVNTRKLQNEINNLREKVIGIFRHRNLGVYELVLKDNGDSLDTVYISSFGAIQTGTCLPLHHGTYKKFPNGQNMNEMLSKPFEWREFIEQFNS